MFHVYQWVAHANQYEPIRDGDFETANDAIAGMNALASDLG